MKNKPQNLSEFQIALRKFKENRLAFCCLIVLGAMYASALFADCLAPYSYKNEERNFSYAPPTRIHLFDQKKFVGPFVYGVSSYVDEFHQRQYTEDQSRRYPLRLFARGDQHKILGLIPSTRHLFGIGTESRFFLLGADARGRDLFSRLLYGGRVSLSIGLIGVAISFTIGLLIGGIAGFYGGHVDNILMRLCEMVMMVPGFYLLLALRAAVPDDFSSLQVYFSIVIILSFIGWAGLARIIRGMCLSLKARDYVMAARTFGLSDLKIIITHILPHTVSYSIFAVMLSIPGYILSESALSLIGLGIQDPFASWGNMLSDAMSIVRIKYYPWILTPAAMIFLTVLCFNIVGDALRDVCDPLLKGQKD
ncbi:ABC transporter permease [Candidatus Omnitrophota bacterium]